MRGFKRRVTKPDDSTRVTSKQILSQWRLYESNHWIAEEFVKALDSEHLLEHWRSQPGCHRCGRDKQGSRHVTWASAGQGTSPLCQDCWVALTPDTRVPYYRATWLLWDMNARYRDCPYGNHHHGREPFGYGHYHPTWESIEEAVRAEKDV